MLGYRFLQPACWLLRLVRLQPTISHYILRSGGHHYPALTTNTHFFCSTATSAASNSQDDCHSIITDKERGRGKSERKEFQAETRKLLDIVAKSLYSDKEVFIRELISNASDALEKLRYLQITGAVTGERQPLEIHLKTDENKKTFIIQDTGVGMTQDEVIDNLGTIARSGSMEFISGLQKNGSVASDPSSIIGQFGVGFYASFMVADKVDVFTRSYQENSEGYKWTSDGMGSYEVSGAESVMPGTKIVLHLKPDAYDYSKEEVIEAVVRRYSNFIGVPIFLNGKRVSVVQPLWLKDQAKVSEVEHEEFFRFISSSQHDSPRYTLFYKTDAPLSLRALFYVPNYRPNLFEVTRETEAGVALYSRKVLITSRSHHLLPKWLRFLKGVVDSEDIPLNLSRELLQDSALLRKINRILTSRVIKFLSTEAQRDPVKYSNFYRDYGLYLKEGIVTEGEQAVREEIGKLLRFESSQLPAGSTTSLPEYVSRLRAGSRIIHFLSAPSRQLAETSPYLEALRERAGTAEQTEVLFLYEPHEELVLMQLSQFDRLQLRSIENEVTDDAADTDTVDPSKPDSLSQERAAQLTEWAKGTLGAKVKRVKVTKRLTSHPCLVAIRELGAVRHLLRTDEMRADKGSGSGSESMSGSGLTEDDRARLMDATLEINPSHPLIRQLDRLRTDNAQLAQLLLLHLWDTALAQAGLLADPRAMIQRVNDLLAKSLSRE